MKRFSLFLVPLLLLFTFVFCGKKGPILPPIKKIPQNVEVFEIAQRGEKLILEWENPSAYADGSHLSEIAEIEIWLAEREGEISAEEFDAKKLAVISGIGARDWFYEMEYKLDGPYVSKLL